jgi:hypothetical protein
VSTHAKAASAEFDGRAGKRRTGSLLAILALALCVLGSSAPAAGADPTVLTVESVSAVGYGSARVKGKVNAGPSGFAFSAFEVSSDGGATWSGFTYENFITDKADHTVERTFTGLKADTTYEVRHAAGAGGGEFFSAEPNLEFTTLPVDPPVVLAVDDPADVFSTTAKASGELERPADPDPLLDAHPAVDIECNFEFVTEEQFNATGFDGAGVAGCDPPNPVEAEGASDVTATLSGLTPSTTYHLRLSGKNAGGTDSEEAANTFTTEAKVPAPTVLTVDDASEVSYNTATLSGEVERPAGEDPELNTSCRFEYITDAQFDQNLANSAPGFEGASAAYCPDPITADGSTDIEMSISGLTHATEYHQRLVVENGGGSDAEEGPTFTTKLVTPPVVEADDATLVTGITAHFSGEVNAGNDDAAFNADCFFDYVTDKEFLVGRTEEQRLRIDAAEGTYRLIFEGEETVVLPLNAPAALIESSLQALSSIGADGVAVSGGPGGPGGGKPYVIDFAAAENVPELGINNETPGVLTVETLVEGAAPGFEGARSIPCEPNSVTGSLAVEADPTGLDPHTVYHLRLRAANQGGESIDEASTFETEPIAPLLQGTSVTDVTTTSVTLHAEVNPGGAATTYHFEYLTLAAFEEAGESFAGATKTPESSSIGSDFTYHAATASIGGLQEDTPYRFRVVAENEKSQPGGTAGPVRRFHTALSPAPSSDACPNAAVRAQQKATNLPGCRAYEIVNPSGVDFGETNRLAAISDDGNAAAFMSVLPGDGAFGNGLASTWVARRGPAGWTSVSADPISLGSSTLSGEVSPRAFSSDLTRFLFESALPFTPGDDTRTMDTFETRVGTGQVTRFSLGFDNSVTHTLGASKDLSEVVMTSYGPNPPAGMYVGNGQGIELVAEALIPASGGARRGLGVYDDNTYDSRKRDMWVERGGAHHVSDDAQRIYYYVDGPNGPVAVRDRKSNPARTVQVSVSSRAGEVGTPHGALFLSASHDGSTAYIASPDQLTEAATPGGGIYEFDLDTESLTQITPDAGDPTGLHLAGALVSDDQSSIYFTSSSALTGAAQAGDNNAYVWSNGDLRFIAKVNTGDRFERVTPDGKYALMLTTASVDGAQNAGFKVAYRYSYPANDITCVSCHPDGTSSEGTTEIETQSFGFPASDVSHSRALTSDGGVVFNTTDSLSPDDVTAAQDVYLYHDGEASLLTSGQEDADSFVGDVSDDGKNIFVISRAAFTGSDRDASEYDVYDVRVNGGFLEPPPPPAPCEGEGCRGAGPGQPPALAATTPKFTGPGNPKPCANGKVRRNGRCVKPRKHNAKKHKHRKHKRDANANGRSGR